MTSDSDQGFDQNLDFTKLLTISQTSIILVIWKPMEVTACMLSSYWYGYLSVFGGQYEEIHIASIIFEVAFLFGMCINLMKQYVPDGEITPVKDLTQTSMRYIKKGSFLADLICIFPFPFIFAGSNDSHLWYMIKIYRVSSGLKLLDV